MERVPKAHRIINGMNADGYQPGEEAELQRAAARRWAPCGTGDGQCWGQALEAGQRRGAGAGREGERALAAARRWKPGTSAGGWRRCVPLMMSIDEKLLVSWSLGVRK